jgi:hypothetical protein
MKPTRYSFCALVLFACLALPARAHAHPRNTSVRIGLGIPALSVTHFPSPDTTTVTYGLYPVTFGAFVGFQITREIGLGIIVLGGGRYDDTPVDDEHFVYFAAVPRFDYLFMPHGPVAPYLGVEVGAEVSGDTDLDLTDIFRTGGFFGLHFFAETEFSIDVELAANFIYNIDADIAGIRGVLYISTTGWLR